MRRNTIIAVCVVLIAMAAAAQPLFDSTQILMKTMSPPGSTLEDWFLTGVGTPGGGDGQLQYNDNGSFDGIANGTPGQYLTPGDGPTDTPFWTSLPGVEPTTAITELKPDVGNNTANTSVFLIGGESITTDGGAGSPDNITIDVVAGGTQGDLQYRNAAGGLDGLAPGTPLQYLTPGDVANDPPQWLTLPVGEAQIGPGGTQGQVQFHDGGIFSGISEGTTGQVVTSQGVGVDPIMADATAGSALGQLQTRGALGVHTALAQGTTGQILTSAGAGAVPTWEAAREYWFLERAGSTHQELELDILGYIPIDITPNDISTDGTSITAGDLDLCDTGVEVGEECTGDTDCHMPCATTCQGGLDSGSPCTTSDDCRATTGTCVDYGIITLIPGTYKLVFQGNAWYDGDGYKNSCVGGDLAGGFCQSDTDCHAAPTTSGTCTGGGNPDCLKLSLFDFDGGNTTIVGTSAVYGDASQGTPTGGGGMWLSQTVVPTMTAVVEVSSTARVAMYPESCHAQTDQFDTKFLAGTVSFFVERID